MCVAAKVGLLTRATDVPIPFGNFKKHINAFLKSNWQSKWDEAINNKLHAIQPQLGFWPGGFRIIRCEEIVLARIQLGHSHLTHSFLLKQEATLYCIACDCRLTIKHISLHCVDIIESRNRHFNFIFSR